MLLQQQMSRSTNTNAALTTAVQLHQQLCSSTNTNTALTTAVQLHQYCDAQQIYSSTDVPLNRCAAQQICSSTDVPLHQQICNFTTRAVEPPVVYAAQPTDIKLRKKNVQLHQYQRSSSNRCAAPPILMQLHQYLCSSNNRCAAPPKLMQF